MHLWRIRYHVFSLMLHLTLLVAGISLHFMQKSITLGDDEHQMINSYVYQAADVSEPRRVESNKMAKQLHQKLNGLLMPKKDHQKASLQHDADSAPQPQGGSRGETFDELLTMLHAAIQRNQQYPESAVQMERQGRVTVVFTLFPDGSIQSLRVLKSSGTASLDAAAVSAVEHSAPFAGVGSFVSSPHEFNIDVVFELA